MLEDHIMFVKQESLDKKIFKLISQWLELIILEGRSLIGP